MRNTTGTSTRPGPTDPPSPSTPDPDLHPSPEAAAAALRAWASLWNTPDEVVLLASSPGEADQLNHRARQALIDTGRLHGPAVRFADLDLMPGDRVVVGNDSIGPAHLRPLRTGGSRGASPTARPGAGLGIPPGCLGDVRLVDPAGDWAVIDFPTRGVARLTASGVARLRHAYALLTAPGVGTRVAGLRVARPARLGVEIPGA